MKLGLEVLLERKPSPIANQRVGLIANPSSVDSKFQPSIDLFHQNPDIDLRAVFGPQHGIRGETQDNMIEWSSFRDRRTGLPAFSLYGETRKPLPEMLSEIDTLVFDLPDVGTRVYTFIYTMALAMQAAREQGKRFVVLDRPNPISGRIEGSVLDPHYSSFVGMFPIAMRHGMTIGELAMMFNREFGIDCDLKVVRMEGWRREMWYDDTGLSWVMSSPNMPALETATVFPGAVLVEGTNVSEGRGTTRPFEIIGAPYVEPHELCAELSSYRLPGVTFRPIFFQPTFQKFAGELCGGVHIHVIDRGVFKPVITGIAVIRAIRGLWPDSFRWKDPPYEYVYDRLPFDVIAGEGRLRGQLERGDTLVEIENSWRYALAGFATDSAKYLMYE